MRAISCHNIITVFNTHVHLLKGKTGEGKRTLPPTGDPTEHRQEEARVGIYIRDGIRLKQTKIHHINT